MSLSLFPHCTVCIFGGCCSHPLYAKFELGPGLGTESMGAINLWVLPRKMHWLHLRVHTLMVASTSALLDFKRCVKWMG